MPSRPRQHVLEEESRRTFRDVIPAEWVVRDQQPDYGLDLQVQPFENGEPTNLLFFVQVKGTDADTDTEAGIKIDFFSDRLQQYAGSPNPVMLVGFHAPSNRLFYAWVHRVVETSSKEELQSWSHQRTVRLHLKHNLTGNKIATVLEEVRRFYRLKAAVPDTAIGLYVAFPESKVDRDHIFDSLATWISSAQAKVRLVSLDTGISPTISEGWEYARLRYADLDARLPTFLSPLPSSEHVIAVLQVLAVLGIWRAGLRVDAARLLLRTIDQYAQVESPALKLLEHPAFWGVFVNVRATDLALEAAEILAKRHLYHHAVLGSAAGIAASSSLPAAERYATSQRSRSIMRLLLDHEQGNAQRATLHYNLANSLRTSGEAKAAVTHYLRAATIDPAYLDRPYWWRELGGALFMRGCVRLACRVYEYAVEIDEDRLAKGLLADVLFHLRRFGDAARLFSEWVSQNPKLHANLLLKWWLAPVLEQEFGSGRRQISLAHRRAVEAYAIEDKAKQFEALHQALQLDPLCEFAWNNYAAFCSEREPETGGAWWLAAATLTGRWELRASAYAIAILENSREERERLLQTAALVEAVRRHGERFFLEVLRSVKVTSGTIEDYVKLLRDRSNTAMELFQDDDREIVLRPVIVT